MSHSANESFQLDAEKEKCMVEINLFVNDFKYESSISDAQLSDAHTEYQKQLETLLYLELLDTNKLNADLIESVFSEQNAERVKTILDERLVDTSDELKSHILNLLELARHNSQDKSDMMREASLHDAIQPQCSRPELWEN